MQADGGGDGGGSDAGSEAGSEAGSNAGSEEEEGELLDLLDAEDAWALTL